MTTTQNHTARASVWQHAPDVYQGMAAFQSAAAKGLDPVVAELVKIRASQINKCAYCLDMHHAEAREQGETQLRLDLLNAWEEVEGLYTERERAALALTESITRLTEGSVPDEVYACAAEQFDEAELPRLIAQIVAINAWNRFQVTVRAVPASLARSRV
ncbi:carboxymuconolactone decarboxylase family protein [Streptomyces oceani]|uniref:4-carboxymuconolactone decarboxylase n=1 Tax=Streptomyces oceani TaxID=1075402 RepID=A0A1E7KIA1_9ACTN|nr:carboxymuconolactone decarboxylase family protein [Streptomyces oceani]OEV03574.1 4-carboxymuconolactone decarboxylase [Streptomyces oceani]